MSCDIARRRAKMVRTKIQKRGVVKCEWGGEGLLIYTHSLALCNYIHILQPEKRIRILKATGVRI